MHSRRHSHLLLVYKYSKLWHNKVLQAGLAGPTEPSSQRGEGQTSGNPPEAAGPMIGKPKDLSCKRLSGYGTPNDFTRTWMKSFQMHGTLFHGLQVQGKAFPSLQQAHRLPTDSSRPRWQVAPAPGSPAGAALLIHSPHGCANYAAETEPKLPQCTWMHILKRHTVLQKSSCP